MPEEPLSLSLSLIENPERLAALHHYGIVGTPPEAAFDDLTRLAAQVCDTPLAFITFVDKDYQFFKSVFGADAVTAPLENGFCPYLVEKGSALVVPNVLEDPKFCAHPAVTAMGLRFYAGVPLVTATGHILGTLCVVDLRPREPSQAQMDSLHALSRQVISQLELRLAAQQMAQTNDALTAVSCGVAATVGDMFFSTLVQQFTQALGVDYAYISLIASDKPNCLRTISVCHQGDIADNFEYSLSDSPCGAILQARSLCWFGRDLPQRFPKVPMLASLNITSYAAIPIVEATGELLGVLAVMDTKPLIMPVLVESLLNIFSVRIATELARRRAEATQTELLACTERALQQAESASRSKDEFLAVVSHELRSPLNPIVGWSQLLQKGKLSPEKATEALSIIERNARLQVRLIDDLLDISRILQGKMSLQKRPVRLNSVITSALETVQLAADAKYIQIETLLSSAQLTVLGDESRLQQIVWNLLSNAVKFTPEGGHIQIELSRPDAAHAKIKVTDTGKGIGADFLPYVFEYFYQENYSTTRQFGGLGLGMAIVRQLTESHGGTVSVFSEGEGKGTTFSLILPLLDKRRSESNKSVLEKKSDLNGVTVLVVDDNSDSRLIAAVTLEQVGATVTSEASSEAALQALEDGPIPDVLISDISMPLLDGYQLIARIRRLPPERGGNILAIALTACADKSDVQKALDAGFHRHLAKPVDPDTLVAAVMNLV